MGPSRLPSRSAPQCFEIQPLEVDALEIRAGDGLSHAPMAHDAHPRGILLRPKEIVVAMRMATPRSRSLRSNVLNSCEALGSRPLVGSSSTSAFACFASAMAMPTFGRMPFE